MKGLTPAELAVVAAVDRDRIGADLAAIVQIPSLTGDETAVQTEAALRMTTAGLDVTRLDIDPATITADPDYPGMEAARTVLPVVAGRLAGGKPGPRRLIAGHIDVVSAGDELQWTVPPFSGRITDGELWGRGSVDMKGGVVAGLAALRAVAEAGVEFAGEVTLLTVPAEEDGGAGALAAIRAGYTGDAAVITEPTNLRIVTAQADAITFTLTVTGRSAHAAFRRAGVSAFEKLTLLAEALRANETARNEREEHRAMRALELPYPTVIGRVRAGDWASSVPDRAVAEGRFGVRLGQTVEEAEAELREVIADGLQRRSVAGRTSRPDRTHRRPIRLVRRSVGSSAAVVAGRSRARCGRTPAAVRRDAVRLGRSAVRPPGSHADRAVRAR